jgi:hypothetical protein
VNIMFSTSIPANHRNSPKSDDIFCILLYLAKEHHAGRFSLMTDYLYDVDSDDTSIDRHAFSSVPSFRNSILARTIYGALWKELENTDFRS